MKRLLFAVLVLGVLGMVVIPAAYAQTEDSVTGTGTSGFCGGSFSIDAHSGPSGETPGGQVTCGAFFNGPVTCLNVQGNLALLTINTSQFGSVALRITDNGSSGDVAEAIPGSGCSTAQPSYVNLGFSGDIVIVDAAPPPPLPTSKDQCKHGGWKTYGVFKNQGDCVSFVATGGKNPPGR